MARRKVADERQAQLMSIAGKPDASEQQSPPQSAQSEAAQDEDYIYVAMFVPGFKSGWRAQFVLDANGCLVARSDVDFRTGGLR